MKERKKITEVVIKQSAEIEWILPNDDGTLSIRDTEGNPVDHDMHLSVGYLKQSGKPKILHSIVKRDGDMVGENPWKKYDKIGFIDTNSIVKGDRKLFVSSPSLLVWKDEERRLANVHHVELYVGLCSVELNPERIGWHDFITRMLKSGLLSNSDEMLLVVDSEKQLIPSINQRTEAVFNDFILPDKFTIAYATTDSGGEIWINKEMKRRDKVCKSAMAAIQQDERFFNFLEKSSSENLYIKNVFENI